MLTLDVEVTNFAEVKNLLVKAAPKRHATFVHIVREVIDELQAMAKGVTFGAFNEFKVNVVNAFAVFVAVDQIKRRAANAFDGGQS